MEFGKAFCGARDGREIDVFDEQCPWCGGSFTEPAFDHRDRTVSSELFLWTWSTWNSSSVRVCFTLDA